MLFIWDYVCRIRDMSFEIFSFGLYVVWDAPGLSGIKEFGRRRIWKQNEHKNPKLSSSGFVIIQYHLAFLFTIINGFCEFVKTIAVVTFLSYLYTICLYKNTNKKLKTSFTESSCALSGTVLSRLLIHIKSMLSTVQDGADSLGHR